jgi:hypothetical protein
MHKYIEVLIEDDYKINDYTINDLERFISWRKKMIFGLYC